MTDRIIILKDGRHLGYTEYGAPEGTPVFFFHGWPSCRLHAQGLDPVARPLNIRIISLDRPGYGNSDFQENRTLLDWPHDVAEVADTLGIKKFAVLGVSGGGAYAAVCGYKIPERISKLGIVVGLAPTGIKGILNGMAFMNKLGWANYHRSEAFRNFSALLCLLQAKYHPWTSGFSFRAKQDQAFMDATFKKRYAAGTREAFKHGIRGAAWDLKLYTQDYGFSLKDIHVRTFLWYGENDKNVSLAMGRYYAKQIPNNTLITYPNEGHLAQWTHAREILKALSSDRDIIQS